ncbi:MAG: M48 family metallopeptidase [Methanobacterium sp.]
MDNIESIEIQNKELESIKRQKLILLNPREYEHPFDKKALNTLEGTPGLEKFAREYNKHAIERVMRLQYTGSCIKVHENNFPDVYQLLEEACATIDLKRIPDLYIYWDYKVNGFTTGSENPLIVLHSGAIDLLSSEELLYILGHECGHIKSGHMLYHEMAQVIPILGDVIGSATLGIGALVSIGLEAALFHWYRMSELTADRAGLLACQDEEAVISALMKASGVPKKFFDKLNTEDFINQAKEFRGYDYDSLDKIAKAATIMWQNHPWTVMRASEILKWVEAGNYQQIIEKHTGEIESLELTCLKCGFKLGGTETFCGNCGAKISGR